MAIAVDAMGGDSPLSVQVEAAVRAVNDFGIEVVLVGAFEQIEETLKLQNYDSDKLRIVNSTETVEMNESPASALRQKKHSSIRVAVDLVKAGEAEAVVSAGNTGASMATAKFVLKSIEGIERPAIASIMPSVHRNHPFVLLDVGANTDCKPLFNGYRKVCSQINRRHRASGNCFNHAVCSSQSSLCSSGRRGKHRLQTPLPFSVCLNG